MKVIIPVAGRGKRLRPLSYSVAKTLMPLAGKRVLDFLLEPILKLNPHEVIIVYDHFNGPPVREYLLKKYPDKKFSFALQEKPLGTADAIYSARDFILEGDEIFIAYSDMVFSKDLEIIYQKNSFDGIIFYFEVEDPQNYGVLEHTDFVLTKLIEKPANPSSRCVNSGVYYLRDGYKFINTYVKRVIDKGKNDRGEYFITDAFTFMAEEGKKINLESIEPIYDCGTVAKLLATNLAFLKGQVIQGENNELVNTNLGKNVVIGSNCFIKNCSIENSIIGDNVRLISIDLDHSVVGDRVVINKSGKRFIVGADATIV
jgi:glucose-1-phosphate thymidylyltransferase